MVKRVGREEKDGGDCAQKYMTENRNLMENLISVMDFKSEKPPRSDEFRSGQGFDH